MAPPTRYKSKIEEPAELVFDVVAEHPEEQHVAAEMQPPTVEEHRYEDRQVDVLVGKRLGASSRVATAFVDDLSLGERMSLCELAGDGGVFVRRASCCHADRASRHLG